MNEPSISRKPLSAQVVQRICQMINSGQYGVGDRLPTEPQLAAQLGVGRSSIREAVQALAHAEVLEVRQGSGTYVRNLPADTDPLASHIRRAQVSDIQEARYVLEGEIARLAALRRGEGDIAAMRTALTQRESLRRAGGARLADYIDVDVAFHLAIANACGNPILLQIYNSLITVIREALLKLNDETFNESVADLHQQLYDMIVARDPDGASATARAMFHRQNLPFCR